MAGELGPEAIEHVVGRAEVLLEVTDLVVRYDDATAIDAAYLAVLTRRPTPAASRGSSACSRQVPGSPAPRVPRRSSCPAR